MNVFRKAGNPALVENKSAVVAALIDPASNTVPTPKIVFPGVGFRGDVIADDGLYFFSSTLLESLPNSDEYIDATPVHASSDDGSLELKRFSMCRFKIVEPIADLNGPGVELFSPRVDFLNFLQKQDLEELTSDEQFIFRQMPEQQAEFTEARAVVTGFRAPAPMFQDSITKLVCTTPKLKQSLSENECLEVEFMDYEFCVESL